MTMPNDADLDTIIFMKVGRHAGEDFEAIIERKRREYDAAGMIFGAMVGAPCTPFTGFSHSRA